MIYFPLYFPSVTFGIFSAEVFPWALILALFMLRKFERIDIYLLLGIVLSSVYGAWRGAESFEIFRGLGSYLNFFAAYMLAKQISYDDLMRVIRINRGIFFLLIFVGIIQFLQIAAFLDPLFKFFIPRGSSLSLTELGNRGASLLSTEPARAGVELLFIYLLFRFSISSRLKLFSDFLMLLFLLVIIKSAMAIFLYLIFFTLSHVRTSFLGVLISIPFAPLILTGETIGRIGYLFVELINSDFRDIFLVVMDSSGHRLVSILTSFYYGIVYPFGGGVGAWKESSLLAIELSGIDVSSLQFFYVWGDGNAISIRSSGLVANLMLDLGVIYSSLFVYSIFQNIKPLFSQKNSETIPLIALFTFKIFFVGSVGTTVEIFCFFLLIKLLTEYKDDKEFQRRSEELKF